MPVPYAVLVMVPILAMLGYLLQALLFARTMRGGFLLPLLTTFGLGAVLQNGIYGAFSSDAKSLGNYIGNLSWASWNLPFGLTVGKLPVNLIFVAEGDEERMSIGYRQFVRQHPELFKGVDAMYRFGSQSFSGGGELSGGSEGCVYVELTTSGAKWGRGPTVSDIHGGNKRSVR